MKPHVTLIVHNIRSTYNVGSILRTCDGLGVNKVYLTGYTPYPKLQDDDRVPHISAKLEAQINKTSLGAQNHVKWEHSPDIDQLILELKAQNIPIFALEQAQNSIKLNDFEPPQKLALLLGEEVDGVSPDLLKMCQAVIEIPMHGQKESFNVSVAAAIALYQICS